MGGKISECHLHSKSYTDAIAALGNNKVRLELTKKLQQLGYHIPILIRLPSVVSQYTNIKEETVTMPQAVINADAKIGKACIINTGEVIEHDCEVGDKVVVDIGEIVGRNEEVCIQR